MKKQVLIKEACDMSYSLIGANRYLCYQKLKQPKDEFLYLIDPSLPQPE
jgi:hypothetical protein